MHIGVYVGEYSLSPLYQTSDNTFIKRLIILLSNVGQHFYQTLDNTVIKRWIIFLSNVDNTLVRR